MSFFAFRNNILHLCNTFKNCLFYCLINDKSVLRPLFFSITSLYKPEARLLTFIGVISEECSYLRLHNACPFISYIFKVRFTSIVGMFTFILSLAGFG